MITRYDRPSEAVLLDEGFMGPDLIYKKAVGDGLEDDIVVQMNVPQVIHEPTVPQADPVNWNYVE